jgi:hypothetical protein
MKSRFSPVKQLAVGRSQWPWRLCCDQANDDIRPMTMIQFCREHYGRSHFCRIGYGKCADYDVSGLQRSSRSCSSKRPRDAAVASARSFSDQESDHSTIRARPRSPSCRAQSRTFLASSGGRVRTTVMSDSSLSLRTISLLLYARFAGRPVTGPRWRLLLQLLVPHPI